MLLEDVPEIALPYEPPDCRHSYYLYTCLVAEEWAGEKRDKLMAMMDEEFGVGCVAANKPAYLTRKLLRDRTPGQVLPRSELLGERLLCVPIHPAMREDDNEYIASALVECIDRLR